MGMDVIGKAPSSKTGESFMANIGWWHPLWDYCCDVAPVARKVKYGHSNDGDGLNAEDARALGAALKQEIESGRTALTERAREAAVPDSTHPLIASLVEQFAEQLCEAS